MVAWSGVASLGGNILNDGGVYDPSTDTWQPIYLVNVPTGIWLGLGFGMSGNAVFVGGESASGGYNHGADFYNPANGQWTSASGAPGTAGTFPSFGAVTTGTAVLWCGERAGGQTINVGWVYDSIGSPGHQMSSPASGGGNGCNRDNYTAVWTGSQMLVYGGLVNSGFGDVVVSNGNAYTLATDSWTAFAGEGFPNYPNRWNYSAVWTGSTMIVWGGHTGANYASGSAFTQSGSIYNPSTSTWTAMSQVNAPTARGSAAAFWTGSTMIVWGGTDNMMSVFQSGAVYDPALDQWTTMAIGPWADASSAVWTGTAMIVWGSGVGGIYHP